MENRFQEMNDYLARRTAPRARVPIGSTRRVDSKKARESATSMAVGARSNGRLGRTLSDAGSADAGAQRSVSAAGVDFIKQFEGFEKRPKEDPAGHCSVGYGTLLHRGACDGRASEAPYAGGISKDEATRLLTAEASRVGPAINQVAARALNQSQFDALTSFVYNVGTGAFQHSTLAKLLAKGDYDGVPDELRKWTKARVGGRLIDLPGLVKRRGAEAQLWQRAVDAKAQSLSVACLGVSLSADKWDSIASQVFGYTSYDNYVRNALTSTSFLGRTIPKVAPQLVDKLRAAEATLNAKGYKSGPRADSTFRAKAGMHGWGLAVDFDALEDPYVLNEAGQGSLSNELRQVYDRIADFVLGLPQSNLRKLTQGRAAFDGNIADVYDALRAESDAMRTYFRLMNDASALPGFLANDWAAHHSGHSPADVASVQQQMRNDYETLGGATTAGGRKPTGSNSVYRPFAPSSSNKGDPATGFLNLDRQFVLALTDAGLAWGAIDFGAESGDVMHFDCRRDGKGKEAFELMTRRS